jgi:beta-glucanase (GH16 family)
MLVAAVVATVAVGCGAQAPHPAPPPTVPSGSHRPVPLHLVWHDDFAGARLNGASWTSMNESTFGDGNDELACLLAANVQVANGALSLSARRVPAPVRCGNSDSRFPDGRTYTSALVETRGKRSFEYGRFEIRARLPTEHGTSQGLWPAFWLRPESGSLGELDVMEATGSSRAAAATRTVVSQTIHYDYLGTHPQQRSEYLMPQSGASPEFHTYAVDWEPGSIRWYVDNALVFSRDEGTTPWLDAAFHGKFYLLLNLAVGGDGVGAPDPDTAMPARYVIDWVRVYQR